MIEEHDQQKGYCRRLGHFVPFAYCRRVSDELPCRLLLDCWFERLPVRAFLERHYTAEQIAGIEAPSPPKISSILSIVKRIHSRQAAEGKCTAGNPTRENPTPETLASEKPAAQ